MLFHVVDLHKRLLMRARETRVGQSLYIQMESQKLPSVISQQYQSLRFFLLPQVPAVPK